MTTVLILLALAGPPQPSGSAIIARMNSMYAHLRSYSDSGVLTRTGESPLTFRTRFKSPGKLYFECTQDNRTWFFCSPGKKGAIRDLPYKDAPKKIGWIADGWVPNEGIRHDILGNMIATFTGISGGIAANIPSSIFPDAHWGGFPHPQDAHFSGIEEVGGMKCFVVKALNHSLRPEVHTFWIGTKTYALYQLREGRDKVTVYKPVLNPKLNDSMFVFKPPKR